MGQLILEKITASSDKTVEHNSAKRWYFNEFWKVSTKNFFKRHRATSKNNKNTIKFKNTALTLPNAVLLMEKRCVPMQSLMAQSYASQIFLSNLYICEKSASKKMSTLLQSALTSLATFRIGVIFSILTLYLWHLQNNCFVWLTSYFSKGWQTEVLHILRVCKY